MKTVGKFYLPFLAFFLTLFLEDQAYAWGPAMHLYYGMSVLERLGEFAPAIRQLLSANSVTFLYGTVSADIVLAKKLGRAMTHCHRWDNGFRLIHEAPNDRVRAFALGYVSHLAADTISHNCYVPSKSIESYDSGFLKHLYWELLFDQKLTSEKTLSLFTEISRGGFEDCDEFLESLIPMRLFDFGVNKLIFDKLLILQGLKHWQERMAKMANQSPWSLSDREVRDFTSSAMNAVMSFLKEMEKSPFTNVDPQGQDRLKKAHAIRRHFKFRLSVNRAPSIQQVHSVKSSFAQEPFSIIDLSKLKKVA